MLGGDELRELSYVGRVWGAKPPRQAWGMMSVTPVIAHGEVLLWFLVWFWCGWWGWDGVGWGGRGRGGGGGGGEFVQFCALAGRRPILKDLKQNGFFLLFFWGGLWGGEKWGGIPSFEFSPEDSVSDPD